MTSAQVNRLVDPLNSESPPDRYWTTSNVGEAAPGVLTPLTWTVWKGSVDRGLRHGAYELGALSASERDDESEPLTQAFAGRTAVSVNFLALLGDRLPGTSGEEVVASAFGRVPDGFDFPPRDAGIHFSPCAFPCAS